MLLREAPSVNTLDRTTLLEMVRHDGWPCVSIYLPTHPVPTQSEHDALLLKNLVRKASETLADTGMKTAEIDELLLPVTDIGTDRSVWREPGQGIACFVAPEASYAFKTPSPVPELAVVGSRLQIRPLLHALGSSRRFFVLALSKKSIRLYEGDGSDVHELAIGDAPSSLAEALRFDDYERNVQFHSRTPAAASGKGRRPAIFHGHGGAPDVEKENLRRYFKQVDRGIHELLHDDDAPLLLAGVEYLLPIYRDANSYSHLVEGAIKGNPDDMAEHDLHAAASALLKPHFESELRRDRADLDEAMGSDASSESIEEIVPAAVEGRVKALFVPPVAGRRGSFDPATSLAEVHDSAEPDDIDLVDLATAVTLLRAGTVHVLGDEQKTAALFRY